jgi:hypothetical protein
MGNQSQSQLLWKLLWDYDPNGLVVVNENMIHHTRQSSLLRHV